MNEAQRTAVVQEFEAYLQVDKGVECIYKKTPLNEIRGYENCFPLIVPMSYTNYFGDTVLIFFGDHIKVNDVVNYRPRGTDIRCYSDMELLNEVWKNTL